MTSCEILRKDETRSSPFSGDILRVMQKALTQFRPFGNDIFNSCNTCFLFLCFEHFSEKVSCTMHGYIVEKNGSIPHHDIHADQTQVSQANSATIPSPISILDEIETHRSYNTGEFRSQTCEVPDCLDEIFSSCNILLCWTHFDGYIYIKICPY